MKYESYKKFFNGGFYPIDSNHKLVNLANTGEFEVTATLGSGSDQKTVKHYVPSTVGLTNMLRNYTGGSKYEALVHSQGHTFIPELAVATSYSGAMKAIQQHFSDTEKPLVIDLDYSDAAGKSIALTFVATNNKVIDWGDGTEDRGVKTSFTHQYKTKGNFRVKIYNWIDGQIKVQQTGSCSIYAPIHTTFGSNKQYYYGTTYLNKFQSAQTIVINFDSSCDFTGSIILYFANEDEVVNFNTGIAEWTNLEECKETLSELYLYAKNLYFDWKGLQFSNSVAIHTYPDEITAKTVITYFAETAIEDPDNKPQLFIMNKPGAQSIYEWAQQYEDKFDSIEIEG